MEIRLLENSIILCDDDPSKKNKNLWTAKYFENYIDVKDKIVLEDKYLSALCNKWYLIYFIYLALWLTKIILYFIRPIAY